MKSVVINYPYVSTIITYILFRIGYLYKIIPDPDQVSRTNRICFGVDLNGVFAGAATILVWWKISMYRKKIVMYNFVQL